MMLKYTGAVYFLAFLSTRALSAHPECKPLSHYQADYVKETYDRER